MRALSSTALLLVLTLCSVWAEARPNVVLILADDLGWNDVGYHGSEIRTPQLDALAADGLVLNRFYSQPTCTPTRAALMTGKAPQRLGIYQQFSKNAINGLPTAEQTTADYFKEAGYQTWLVGKWHLGHTEWQYHPTQRGFDHFYGHVTGGIGFYDHVHGGGLDWQRNGRTVREEGYSTHLLADEATALIEARNPDQPFFLYASFNAPHLPNEAPEATIAAYAGIENPHRRIHAAMVTELDMAIQQIVETLKTAGLYDNTVIWFMSDNGGLYPGTSRPGAVPLAETLQDWFGKPLPNTFLEFIRVNSLEGGSDNTPLRMGKGSVYEGGARVPSLLHWPAGLHVGSNDAMVTVQDVLPTLLAVVDEPIPDDLDGRNRWPTLTGLSDQPPADYVTRGQFGYQAYYQWPWKLIEAGDDYELYNIEADPLEAQDLSAQDAQKVAALRDNLAAWPRAESLHIPIYKVIWDPDFFGGEEDRPPWADLVVIPSDIGDSQ